MVFSAPPNCCKRLTKRRLFTRRPSGPLEQSALGGGALSARSFSKRRTKRAAVSVAVFSRFAIYANVVGQTERRRLARRHSAVDMRSGHLPFSRIFALAHPLGGRRVRNRSCSVEISRRIRRSPKARIESVRCTMFLIYRSHGYSRSLHRGCVA